MSPSVAVIFAIGAFIAGLVVGWFLASRSASPLRVERDEARSQAEEWRLKFNEAVVNLAAEVEKTNRLTEVETQLATERESAGTLRAEVAAFERGEMERERAHQQQMSQLKELQSTVETRFGELAGQAVESAHDKFLKRAEEKLNVTGVQHEAKLQELLQPMKETLQRYETGLRQLEQDRKGAYEGLTAQLSIMREGQERVATEALRLRTALRSSTGDVGRWGEEQCRNVLERAGLQEGIDFEEQVSTDASGDRSKPDFVVNVPGNRRIIIDVKCSVDSYIGASETEDEAQKEKLLGDHARAIRNHAQSLMKRAYQDKFKNSATFVVMFIPGENFLHAAIQRDSKLLPDGHKGNIMIVGPTNLLSIVLNVAALRDQARLAERAEQIGALGRKLYENLSTLGKKAHLMSGAVQSVVRNWNSLVSTLDGHWLSTAREFDKLGVGKGSADVREVELLDVDIHEPRKLGIAGDRQDNDDDLPQIAAE
jgi:DNA recombination protein RmuC